MQHTPNCMVGELKGTGSLEKKSYLQNIVTNSGPIQDSAVPPAVGKQDGMP